MGDSSFNIQNYFKRGKTVVLTLRQGDPDEVRQWSDTDTENLLSMMNAHLPDFRNSRKRKKEVWAEISKDLSDSGYSWTQEDCRKKWSNMVRTFKGIQEQRLDPASLSKKIKWPFFECMMDLFMSEGADCFPESTSIIPLLNVSVDVDPTLHHQSVQLQPQGQSSGLSPSNSSSGDMVSTSQPVPMDAVILTDSSDMVGVAVDLASIINSSETNLHAYNSESLRTIEPSESSSYPGCGLNSSTDVKSGQSPNRSKITPKFESQELKTYIRKGLKRKKVQKKNATKRSPPETEASCNTVMENFLSTIVEQNGKIIEMLSSLTESTKHAMQDRNNTLKRLCDVFEKQCKSTQNYSQDIETATASNFVNINDTDGGNFHIASATSIASDTRLRNTSRATPAFQLSINNSGTPTLIPADTVAVVDPHSFPGLISQDPSGRLTFHLEVPPDSIGHVSDGHGNVALDSKILRLENISSDVNLSSFSAVLQPTLVHADSTRETSIPKPKPISAISKTATHATRKIAPRK